MIFKNLKILVSSSIKSKETLMNYWKVENSLQMNMIMNIQYII